MLEILTYAYLMLVRLLLFLLPLLGILLLLGIMLLPVQLMMEEML